MARSPLNHPLVITQSFMADPASYPGTHGHPGVDLRSPLADDWFACVPGVLGIRTDRDWLGRLVGYGQAAFVDWGQADNTFVRFLYGHGRNRRRKLEGKHVDEGQYIAESGNTGRSTAAHLHFEMRRYYRPRTGHGRLYDKSVGLTYNLLDPVKDFFEPNGIPYVHV
jgi:murein DD-endopeptidase MepM/ murein hydrolase activator NlpD